MCYNDIYLKVLRKYTKSELIQIGRLLNKQYNIYDPEETRWRQIQYALFNSSEQEILELKKYYLSNKFVNDFLLDNYACERVIKYHFIRSLLNLSDNIVAFEMSVGGSRVDISRINGNSYAYEIKTEFDSFDRLSTQMSDYSKAFEKVYVVVPAFKVEAVKQHIPDNCGIIAYRPKKQTGMTFSYVKRAYRNNCSADFCIKNLSSADMSTLMKMLGLEVGTTKKEKEAVLLTYAEKRSIWPAYKKLLKNKYHSNWLFIKKHFDQILPIDIQNFFVTSLSPDLLYQIK